MAYHNFVNLTDADLDRPIYRIMPVSRMVDCLTTRKLTLIKPKKWDDPFENFLLSATVELASGERGSMEPIRNSVFGLCWTRHRETDAMWRIYSYGKDGVRVRSTPRKLFGALKAANPEFGDVQCFVGRVQYHNKDDLIRTLQEITFMDANGSGIAESLLHKRQEFSHEDEVRLIHLSSDKVLIANSDIYQFEIDPNDIFEQAIFDPRMERATYLKAETTLRGHGYENKIGQSNLYRPPAGLVIKL
jgi:hypothetical protein